MNQTWAKIVAWTKITVISLVAIYVMAFFIANRNANVNPALDFIFWRWEGPKVLLVLLLTALFSIIGWWLFRTIFKTMRQLNESRTRSRVAKTEREIADMKAKAAMLQTKPASGDGVTVQVDHLGEA